MSIQHSAIDTGDIGSASAMKSRPTHTLEILRDDIYWLETQIQQLTAGNGSCERKLADCYRRLLGQRKQQLASAGPPDAGCPGCWHDYPG